MNGGGRGFWGRLLEVDLSTGKTGEYRIPEEAYRRFIGGRGLATWILWRELGSRWPEVDPLGHDNILLFLTGPITGYYPGVKMVVSGKSPQSNGVVGSTLSSEVAVHLKAAGYDGLLVRGRADSPVYIYIEDDRVEVRDASRLWGTRGTEFLRKLYEEVKPDWKDGATPWPPTLYIGPAGENLVRTAVVMANYTHAAGYGGYGAVMGSKNLKAVVVRGKGALPKVADPEKLLSLRRELLSKLSGKHGLRYWGTAAGLYYCGVETSSEPVRNWQEEWHDRREFSVMRLEAEVWRRRFWADWGCPVACMKVSVVGEGGGAYVTDAPDYEMGAYLGANLGIFDVREAALLSAVADDLGLCGIQTGNVLGFAFELYEKGILTLSDVGYELRWGDSRTVRRLLEDIAYRRGIGKVLAEGTYRAARIIAGMKGLSEDEVLRYAVQVKGIGVGAHGVRSKKDYPQPIAYAASVQGGDHTSVAGVPADSSESESWAVLIDSLVACMFLAVEEEVMIDYLNAVTGWDVTKEEVYKEIGPRTLALQRILLLLGGPDAYWDPRIHDDNPPRFYEPLPSGPYKGAKADREEVERMKREYYEGLGWDEHGIPREETLKKLGLEDAVEAVRLVKRRLGLEP